VPLYVDDPAIKAEEAKWRKHAAAVIESNGYEILWPRGKDAKVSRWDFEAHNLILPPRKRPWISVEVKRRLGAWGDYPSIFLDVSKATALLPVGWFVVVADDLRCRFAWITAARTGTWAIDTRAVQVRRGDRNDKADRKYLIPTVNFHPLYDLRGSAT
jgi:hypothetical protein